MKNKSKIIIGIIASTMLLSVAGFTVAQTTNQALPGISKTDLQPIVDDQTALQNAINSNQSQATIDNLRKKAVQACVDLGKKVLSLTYTADSAAAELPNSALGELANLNTIWTSNGCQFGHEVSPKGGSDLPAIWGMRTDRVVSSTAKVSGLWGQIMTTGFTLNSDQVNKSNIQGAEELTNGIGSTAFSAVDEWIDSIITSIFNVLIAAVLALVSGAGIILNTVLNQTTNALQPQIIDTGWKIIRDLMNMFFILALIAMSLGTILRLESYNARKLILRLILMALLINFSAVIAKTLISVSDSITHVFTQTPQWSVGYLTRFSALATHGGGFNSFFNSGNGAAGALAQKIVDLLASLLILASFGAIAILLVIRLVGLWILVMLSPIAYALNILPRTQQYSKKWWEYFLKYLTWAPVAVFFLYIGNEFTQVSATLTSNNVLNSLVIAVFFWGALFVVKQAGMMGSDAILKGADKVWKGGTGMLTKYALRGSWLEQAANVSGNQRFKNLAKKVTTGTAIVEGLPQTIREPLDRSEKARINEVKKQSRLTQITFRAFGVDKDNASSISPEEIERLHGIGKLDQKTISTLWENGGRSQKLALLNALNRGWIDVNKNPETLAFLQRESWKYRGGKLDDMPEDYLTHRDENNNLVDIDIIGDPKKDYADKAFKDQKIDLGAKRKKAATTSESPTTDTGTTSGGGRGTGTYKQTPGFRPTTPSSSGGATASVAPAPTATVTSNKVETVAKKLQTTPPAPTPTITVDNARPTKVVQGFAPTPTLAPNKVESKTTEIKTEIKTEEKPVTASSITAPKAAAPVPQQGADLESLRKAVSEGVKEGNQDISKSVAEGVKAANQEVSRAVNEGLAKTQQTIKETAAKELNVNKQNAEKLSTGLNEIKQETASAAAAGKSTASGLADKLDEAQHSIEQTQSLRNQSSGTPSSTAQPQRPSNPAPSSTPNPSAPVNRPTDIPPKK